jgi:hypothetical protein
MKREKDPTRIASHPRNANRVASNPRVTSCSNPQSALGKYFINMKNEDVVILVGPENSIFYCYTESEFQRILNEKPPFVLQGERKPVAMQRQDDPKRTFWVYNTYFGYVDIVYTITIWRE